MNKNYSLPKLNSVDISNRLNRLKQRTKPRLQFPKHIQSKKHFFDAHIDNVKFNHQKDQKIIQNDGNQSPNKSNRRDKLDISDIQGARPRKIQKQKNVQKYYRNVNDQNHPIRKYSEQRKQYNPFAPLSNQDFILPRVNSQQRLKPAPGLNDALDKFQKQMQNKLTLNPEHRRQTTEPNNSNHEKNNIYSSINAFNNGDRYDLNNYKNMGYINLNSNRKNVDATQKKTLISNPTFMSSLMLL